MNISHIKALLMRYAFMCSRNMFRLFDVFFWPIIDLVVWGLMTIYLLKVNNGIPTMVTFLLGALIFWSILHRAQQAVCISVLEDVWSRNFLNVFVAPITVSTFIATTFVVGLLQALIILLLTGLLAIVLYSFNIFVLGLSIVPFFINLLMLGWTLGLIATSLIIRYGQSAQILAWALPFLVQPISAVYYPVSVLPTWLQPLALSIPASYIFEGMRSVLNHGVMPVPQLLIATGLNLLYLTLSALFFQYMFNEARKAGALTKLVT